MDVTAYDAGPRLDPCTMLADIDIVVETRDIAIIHSTVCVTNKMAENS